MKNTEHFTATNSSNSPDLVESFRELSDSEWSKIDQLFEPFYPTNTKSGRPQCYPREVLNAILWIRHTRQSWLVLPAHYPSASSCKHYYQDWQKRGLFEQIAARIGDTMPSILQCLPAKNKQAIPPSNSLLSILNSIVHPLSK